MVLPSLVQEDDLRAAADHLVSNRCVERTTVRARDVRGESGLVGVDFVDMIGARYPSDDGRLAGL